MESGETEYYTVSALSGLDCAELGSARMHFMPFTQLPSSAAPQPRSSQLPAPQLPSSQLLSSAAPQLPASELRISQLPRATVRARDGARATTLWP